MLSRVVASRNWTARSHWLQGRLPADHLCHTQIRSWIPEANAPESRRWPAKATQSQTSPDQGPGSRPTPDLRNACRPRQPCQPATYRSAENPGRIMNDGKPGQVFADFQDKTPGEPQEGSHLRRLPQAGRNKKTDLLVGSGGQVRCSWRGSADGLHALDQIIEVGTGQRSLLGAEQIE